MHYRIPSLILTSKSHRDYRRYSIWEEEHQSDKRRSIVACIRYVYANIVTQKSSRNPSFRPETSFSFDACLSDGDDDMTCGKGVVTHVRCSNRAFVRLRLDSREQTPTPQSLPQTDDIQELLHTQRGGSEGNFRFPQINSSPGVMRIIIFFFVPSAHNIS